jgi:hypothetical protein
VQVDVWGQMMRLAVRFDTLLAAQKQPTTA